MSADGCPDPHQSLDTALNPVGHNEESLSVGTGALLLSPNKNPWQPFPSPACLDSGIASLAPVCDTNKSQEAVPIQIPSPSQVHIPSHVPVLNHLTLPSSIPIPISGRHDNHMSAAPHLDSNIVIGSVDDGSNLPLPMMLPRKRYSLDSQEQAGSNWEKPGGSEPQVPRRVPHVHRLDYVSEGGDLCADISEDIHAEAERVVGGTTEPCTCRRNTNDEHEILIQQQLTDLNVQLTEAKEEIAVKEAQIQQYQKLMEAYKQQVIFLYHSTIHKSNVPTSHFFNTQSIQVAR